VDTTQTQSQTQRLRIAKTDFKSVRKTILGYQKNKAVGRVYFLHLPRW